MKLKKLLAGLTMLLGISTLSAQVTRDVIGVHNLGPGGASPVTGKNSPISGGYPGSCAYCHAPHSGLTIGLWNQKLTTQTYAVYDNTSSTTEVNKGKQPTPGHSSNQCLSCHDGTVAVGTTVAYGTFAMQGSMPASDVFGSNLQSSHPFSLTLPLKDNVDLAASLVANQKTADLTGAVTLINGNVECSSCHNPHVQAKDLVAQNFLVKDSSMGAMCLSCHDPTRQMTGQVNPIADWAASAHALSGDTVSPQALVGSYATVAANACIGCHAPHNAGVTARLLRGKDEQDCIACHNGGSNITNGQTQYMNVFSEYASGKVGHPFPNGTNAHDATEGTNPKNVLLNNNRHATCVDCHNPHSSVLVGTFTAPPTIRASQKDIAGISATDGITVLTPAVNQYENCLRCHATSIGKQVLPAIYKYLPVRAVSASDPLNLVPQFALAATSSHPVTHTSNSMFTQYSLLTNMLNLDGVKPGRLMGSQILCTDCHNSDDNREFGGSGPNGPHGSIYPHILERNYQFSQATIPGGLVANLFPTPDLTVTGPYALCAKCHNLSVVLNQAGNNTSWSGHTNHTWNDGFSCSTCHTAHGMGATSPTISGDRLVNFDVNVVAPNGTTPITYTSAGNTATCVLVCHQVAHNADGTVAAVNLRRGLVLKK